MKNRFFQCLIILAVSLSGCSMYVPVDRGEFGNKRYGFAVPIADADWMQRRRAEGWVITRDGELLQYIRVQRQPLGAELSTTKRRFIADMSPLELAEVEQDVLRSQRNIGYFEVVSSTPVTVDGREAFRLEYSLRRHSGLHVRGIRYGFIHEDRVFRLHFEAAQEHYFDQYQKKFENIVENFKVL